MAVLTGTGGWTIGARGRAIVLGLGLGAAAGCGGQNAVLPLGPEPIPYVDTVPVAEMKGRDPVQAAKLFETALGDELIRPLNLRRWAGHPHEALNITHFDDVVNSAWFEHRNDRHPMTPEQVARGPATTDGPDTAHVMTVIAGKAAGISPGFTVRDARGDVYLVKFDPAGHLYLGSAADVISSRLFYAAGYHTPEDFIVVFDSARLELDPEARITTAEGKRRMRRDDIRAVLSGTDPLPDGRFLGLASKFLKGVPKGPFFFRGVRKDDPNDYYHHEYRRELRGLYVVASWLNHVDMRFGNTLDMYVEPGYLRHYLIDFAATLGSGTIRPHRRREGREYNYDHWPTIARIFSLGFFTMGWEDRPYSVIHPSIGWLPVEEYDPGSWKANWPNRAFSALTTRDGYWGSKLVAAFTDGQLRAVVAEAKLPSAEVADTLVKILAYRRDRTVEYWFSKVSPIEDVEVAAEQAEDSGAIRVTFRDSGLDAGIWTAGETSYRWEFRHEALHRHEKGEQPAAEGARQSLRIDLADDAGTRRSGLSERDKIATLRVSTVRPGAEDRAATVYLRWEEGRYSVVGLEH